jgi:hypothetical protein
VCVCVCVCVCLQEKRGVISKVNIAQGDSHLPLAPSGILTYADVC